MTHWGFSNLEGQGWSRSPMPMRNRSSDLTVTRAVNRGTWSRKRRLTIDPHSNLTSTTTYHSIKSTIPQAWQSNTESIILSCQTLPTRSHYRGQVRSPYTKWYMTREIWDLAGRRLAEEHIYLDPACIECCSGRHSQIQENSPTLPTKIWMESFHRW